MPATMPMSRPSRRSRLPPQIDSTMMQMSVVAAIATLLGRICHCVSSPSVWRVADSTRAMPPMQITVPTTAGGNSGRMRVTSGPTAKAITP